MAETNGSKAVTNGAVHAYQYLNQLKKDPGSVMLLGWIQDIAGVNTPEELVKFTEVIQDELKRTMRPEESPHSRYRNPLLQRNPADSAETIGDAIGYMCAADAHISEWTELGDAALNGRYRILDCISGAAYALAEDLKKGGDK